jgi:DNA-binding response OmpR family regulator
MPPRRVLIIDEDPEATSFYGTALQDEGFSILHTSADLEPALESAKLFRPDVVLLDLDGGMNGRSRLAEELSGELPGVPFIALAEIGPDVTPIPPSPPFARVIYKPCRARTLLQVIEDLIDDS